MSFSYSPLDVSLLVLAAFGAVAMHVRLMRPVDSNLPLVFWAAAVAFQTSFGVPLQDANELYGMYAGVVSALVLRFEFMAAWLTWPFRLLDLAAMGYFVWRCGAVALHWRS